MRLYHFHKKIQGINYENVSFPKHMWETMRLYHFHTKTYERDYEIVSFPYKNTRERLWDCIIFIQKHIRETMRLYYFHTKTHDRDYDFHTKTQGRNYEIVSFSYKNTWERLWNNI